MRRIPKYDDLTGQQKKVHDILQLFERYSPTGLLVFYGEADFPTAEELYNMKTEQYIAAFKARHHGTTPESIPTKGSHGLAYSQRVVEVAGGVEQIIRDAGGLDTFKASFAEISQTLPRDMDILHDLSRRTATGTTMLSIAMRNYLSRETVCRIRKKIFPVIAINICARAKAGTLKAESKKAG